MTAELIVLTATLAFGAVLLGTSLPAVRGMRLRDRVEPYVGDRASLDRGGQPRGRIDSVAAVALLTRPLVSDAIGALDRVLGGSESVSRRLDRLGTELTVERFRLEQLGWGAAGLVAAAILGSGRVASGDLSGLAPFLIALSLGFASGVLMRDRWLSRAVSQRMQRLATEFPTVVELLALSVGAGESLLAALERTSRVGRGVFVGELSAVLAAVRSGTGTVEAFGQLARRLDTPEVIRFVDAVTVALERGTPLVEVLNAQVLDAREASRRALIEAGGRKEIAMMVPVVFMVLPLSVVFALFPGFYGLSLGSL